MQDTSLCINCIHHFYACFVVLLSNIKITQEFECLVKRERSELLKELPSMIVKVMKYATIECASRPKLKELLETHDSEKECFPCAEGILM